MALDRRRFLQLTATSVAALGTTGLATTARAEKGRPHPDAAAADDFRWSEATFADLQAAMESGEATAVDIVRDHLVRIEALDWAGPQVNSIIEVNPDAEAIAAELDQERRDGQVRGPLHGIPIVLKDAIATDDRMETTAGSLALVGSKVPRDAGVVARRREAGAIMLGKANMSEWNAFRGWPLHGGWSGRAGIGVNPYALNRSTGDSSTGSAAAVAASFAAGAVGMETYGSIIMPSSLCGIVGLKPTTGLTSRSGVIPISFTRDATGPMARTVTDVAILLNGMVGVDPLDDATRVAAPHVAADYRDALDPDGLDGARIGVWRRRDLWEHWQDPRLTRVIEDAIELIASLGATIVDDVDIPNWADATGAHNGVMFVENPVGINRYLRGLVSSPVRSLADVVAFNDAHPREELRWHNQGLLEGGLDQIPLSDPAYASDLELSRKLGRRGFASAMNERRLDAIVAPTFVLPWLIDLSAGDHWWNGNGAAGPSNAAGYPHLTVPAGSVGQLPVGISFLARAWTERRLLRYGYAFEQASKARRAPAFVEDYRAREFVER
jgi:amidase